MSKEILVRRSNLLVPLDDASALADGLRSDADALTLDLGVVPAKEKARLRDRIEGAVDQAASAAVEVFARVDKSVLYADLEAVVWPGLTGIVLPRIEAAAEVQEAAVIVSEWERRRGLPVGSLAFIVEIDTARAVWDIRSILQASSRISQMGLNEGRLASNLGFEPDVDLDPFEYARGRLVVEAIAAGVGPIGMCYPLSVRPRHDEANVIQAAATKAKNLGMKGIVCPYASWVEPVNRAFTPTPELVEWNRRVREAFAAGVAAGTAAVPLDGKMIDVPVDEWAIVVLATAEACARRDAQKRAARASSA